MRNRMLGTWAVLIACGLLAFAASAEAASVNSVVKGSQFGTINTFSDDSVEYISTGGRDGTLDVGDVVRGIFNINSIRQGTTTTAIDNTFINQLTGVFQTKVLSKTETAVGSGKYIFTFGPDPAFAEAIALKLDAGNLGVAGTGAMVIFFEDTPGGTQWTTAGGPGNAANWTNATDGQYYMSLGYSAAPTALGPDGIANTADDWTSSAGEGWITGATEDPSSTTYPDFFGDAKFAMNRLLSTVLTGNADGFTLALLTNPFGSTLMGTQAKGDTDFGVNPNIANNPADWPIIDEANFSISVIVPIPAAAWMGFALLGGLGLTRRLRRRNRN